MKIDRIRQNQGTARAFHEKSSSQAGESSGDWLLTVVFTTAPATLAALREAAALALELGARIRIFVPYVVPYSLPLNRPQADPDFRIRHFRALCEQEQIDACIEIKLCRDARECLVQELPPQSVLLIGYGHPWPLSGPLRLAKSLQRRGHQVLLARQRVTSEADSKCARSLQQVIMYNRVRLAVIVSFLIINSSCALESTMRHKYPIGVAAVLFLIPTLLRELDLKHGKRPRKLGPFGWSCLLAGMFFLMVFPLIVF